MSLTSATVALFLGATIGGGLVAWRGFQDVREELAAERATRAPFNPSPVGVLLEDAAPGPLLDPTSVWFFKRIRTERFMLMPKGPIEVTGNPDLPALFFQRQGGDGLWYNVEAYSPARAGTVYDAEDPINGRPINEPGRPAP